MGTVSVGVVANPASGRDVRRLVTGASVFDNAEKGAMVHRLMVGLGAAGVDRVVMMPAASGVSQSLRRHLGGRTGPLAGQPLPELEVLEMPLHEDARDSAAAVLAMAERRVAAIVVLGGDGTHRVVARHCGDIPLCALSTGTNNAFPELREATVAGIATGLVATGRLGGDGLVRRVKRLEVAVGGGAVRDSALVDVAVTAERWVGSRALWRAGAVSEALVTFASPSAVGLSAVAAAVEPVARAAPHGLHLRLAPPERAPRVVAVPLAPGLVTEVGVLEAARVAPGQVVALAPRAGCLALDGEREIELGPADRVTVRLAGGPLVIDVDAVMAGAARQQVLHTATRREADRGNHRPTGPGQQGAAPGVVPHDADHPGVRGAAPQGVRHRRDPRVRPPLRG
jgi:predicted polyphosphate/ATP-dependent NAD kinase